MSDLLHLTTALARTMRDHAPGWTDRNDADPGITMLEMLAYLAEALQFRRGLVAGGSGAASRIVQAVDAYEDDEPIVVRVNGKRWERVRAIADAPPDAGVFTLDETTGVIAFGDGVHGRVPERGSSISARYRAGGGEREETSIAVRSTWPLAHREFRITLRDAGTLQLERCVMLYETGSAKKRTRFFSGKLLTADDLAAEQQYHLGNHRDHLRMFHGSGIVQGLQVETGTGGDTIVVRRGVAIDGEGREICLDADVTLTVPAGSQSPALILVEYAERPVDPVPVSTGGGTEPSRIEEACRIMIASDSGDRGVAVARIVQEQGGWRLDPAFVPARTR